ncbi:protein LNK1-like isoform X2 [Tripterygium wilfordii]|uniref:protein LNK1-like isoform X2 n=2 Tax=Tripterygium wilfordii TaxID=458696 RepID=UPI0018F82C00|nr:protein LNK1-like isoform X2 [Tripterygium wilfordii]
MSDLCLYELEDSAWHEFGGSEDHIVPHRTGGYVNQCGYLDDSCKKLRREVIVTNYADKAKYSNLRGHKSNLATLTDEVKMLEKDSWSVAPDGVFPTSCDESFKEVTRAASDAAKMSSDSVGTELCVDNRILGEGGAAIDGNLYHYPLSHISQVDNDLSFLDNDREDKASSDLFDGWQDIVNFEDVDRMFRGCDSSFGLGTLSHEDELSWFAPLHTTEVSEDAFKSGPKFTCSEERASSGVSEHYEASRSNDAVPSINDESRSFSTVDKINPWTLHASSSNHSCIGQTSSLNGPSPKSRSSDGWMANEQPRTPCMHQEYGHPSNQISSCCTQSVAKSEDTGLSSAPWGESSYASNPVQSMESSYCATCDASAIATNSKRENLYHQKDLEASFTGKFQHEGMVSRSAFCDPVSDQKQAHQSELEIEGRSEVGGVSVGIPSELDSSNAHESSSVSSLLDESSVEASSFRQLQKVMKQLDIRTKLCIRDSLYRLAKSAEQRHNCRNSNGDIKNGRQTSGAPLTEETDKLMDMETDTNPIDRSIAHLLFHRPSDISARPTTDAMPLKSNPMIHGTATSSAVMDGEMLYKQEDAAGTDKRLIEDAKH